MCFALPQKIIKLKKNQAITDQGKILDCSLVSVKIGDWVLAQNNFVINKISTKQAKNIITITAA